MLLFRFRSEIFWCFLVASVLDHLKVIIMQYRIPKEIFLLFTFELLSTNGRCTRLIIKIVVSYVDSQLESDAGRIAAEV